MKGPGCLPGPEVVWPEEDAVVPADEDLEVVWELVDDGDTMVRVPAEFLEAGKEYKVEILAQESTGNRAAAEIPFVTEED